MEEFDVLIGVFETRSFMDPFVRCHVRLLWERQVALYVSENDRANWQPLLETEFTRVNVLHEFRGGAYILTADSDILNEEEIVMFLTSVLPNLTLERAE